MTRTDKRTGLEYGVRVQIDNERKEYETSKLSDRLYTKQVFVGAFKGNKIVGYGVELIIKVNKNGELFVSETFEGDGSVDFRSFS